MGSVRNFVFFFKQKTAYEMRISYWSSDVCSSDLPMLSTGQIAAPGQAIAWRGPMAGKALGQLVDASWGDIDTLVVDLPPGTGDVQLTMIQRSEERRGGKECVSTCRSRWSP